MRWPALALVAVWAIATTVGPTSSTAISDIGLYRAYADLLLDGQVPFRDFAVEYPPLAFVPLGIAGLAGDGFEWVFSALMLAAALVIQRECALLAGPRGRRVAWMLVLLPLLAGAIVRTRFDLVAVAFAVAGLRAGVEERWGRAGVLLGLGAAVKLFPALIVLTLGAALLGAWRHGDLRRLAVAFAGVVAISFGPFLLIAPAGVWDAGMFHVKRPVQIESTPASVVLAIGDAQTTGHPVRPDEFRSNGVTGGSSASVGALFLALQLAALAAVAALAHGRRIDAVTAAAAALLVFVALGKVLSPQFLTWLAPFAALLWARGARAPAAAIAAAVLATQLEFPARYWDLVGGDPDVIALVGLRNVLLLGALSLLLAPAVARARSSPPLAAASTG